jgi:integrative and conjugative element protein (TIGR02256 family)
MEAEASHAYPLETGGVLLGYWSSGREVVIRQAIGPGPEAMHRSSYFAPDHDFHEREIARVYEESRGTCTYLGDWHTHPHSHPRLSRLDRHTLRSIALHAPARVPLPLMAVLGFKAPWKFTLWALVPISVKRLVVWRQVVKLTPITYLSDAERSQE